MIGFTITPLRLSDVIPEDTHFSAKDCSSAQPGERILNLIGYRYYFQFRMEVL
ncbi:MAG: hypothetical protein HRU40_03545 [Saprospiraceae bacterium]|nr:hypothetical protein [Saprospiraceae bacterium]